MIYSEISNHYRASLQNLVANNVKNTLPVCKQATSGAKTTLQSYIWEQNFFLYRLTYKERIK